MQVLLEKEAAKYLERLNEPMKGRILDALDKLANEPPEGDIRKLQGQETAYRLRIGDFRVLFKQKAACLAVYKIAPRGQAYKGKK
jgi:mRNA interferase RelE/StbE